MRLVYKRLDLEMNFNENEINVLIIENPTIYSDVIQSFINQSDGLGGNFLCSVDNKEIALSKVAEIIITPFDVDINNKKIITKIYTEIDSEIMISMSEKAALLNKNIIEFLDEVVSHVDYDIVYEPAINFTGLFKLMDLKNRNQDDELINRLINYIKLMHTVLNRELFVFVNIKMYLSEEEIEELYKFCAYEKIHVLLIEGFQNKIYYNEKVWIIDKDLCII